MEDATQSAGWYACTDRDYVATVLRQQEERSHIREQQVTLLREAERRVERYVEAARQSGKKEVVLPAEDITAELYAELSADYRCYLTRLPANRWLVAWD